MQQKLLVRYLRRTREISLDVVSNATGIDVSTLSRLERGLIQGTDAQRYALAGYYGRPVDELFKPVPDTIAEAS